MGYGAWMLGVLACVVPPPEKEPVTTTEETGEPSGCDGPTGYLDLDGDGFGSQSADPCGEDLDVVPLGGDCDDADPEVFPGATELCDLERDCDPSSVPVAQVGDQGFSTLGEALDAAPEGGLVELCDGTLQVELRVDRDVTLASRSGQRDLTVLEAASGSLIVVEGGAALTLRSLTLRGGQTSGSGGAVDASSGGLLTVEDCVLEDNAAATTGGAVSGTDVTLVGSVLRRNAAQDGGGAVAARGALEVVGCTLEDNETQGSGGAILGLSPDGPLRIEGSSFLHNQAVEEGGAIQGSALEIVDCSFTENQVTGYLSYGGAVAVSEGAVSISGTTFDANLGPLGGALSLSRSVYAGSTLIVDSAFTANEASNGGAAYVVRGGGLELQGVTFTGNQALWVGGALSLWEVGATADAATIFEGNLAPEGGALRLTALEDALSWTGGTFLGNFADNLGGAAYVMSGSQFTLSGMTVQDNTSGYSGGGLYLDGEGITLLDSVVAQNEAESGGGVSVNWTGPWEVLLERVELRGNVATSDPGGGGLWLREAHARLVDCAVLENEAERGGGVLVDELSQLWLEGTDLGEVQDNEPDDLYIVEADAPSYTDLGADVTLSCVGGQGCAP
jgi:hypothetical protein